MVPLFGVRLWVVIFVVRFAIHSDCAVLLSRRTGVEAVQDLEEGVIPPSSNMQHVLRFEPGSSGNRNGASGEEVLTQKGRNQDTVVSGSNENRANSQSVQRSQNLDTNNELHSENLTRNDDNDHSAEQGLQNHTKHDSKSENRPQNNKNINNNININNNNDDDNNNNNNNNNNDDDNNNNNHDDGYNHTNENSTELEEVPMEGCDIFNKLCSPFHGSPCNRVDLIPGMYHDGRCSLMKTVAEGLWEPCGNVTAAGGNRSACYCYRDRVSCCGGLNAIPDFSAEGRSVVFLNFTSNNLTRLDRDTVGNYTSLRWLILNRNNVSVVSDDALENLTSLEHLELAHNNILQSVDAGNFTEAVNRLNGSLRVLAVNYTQFSKPPSSQSTGITHLVRHLRLHNLTQLFVDGCGKKKFYLSDVLALPNLCKLSLKSNRLEKLFCCSSQSFNDSLENGDENVDEPNNSDAEGLPYGSPTTCISPESTADPRCQNFALPKLKLLDLANNSLIHVPRFCINQSNSQDVLPQMTHLSLSINAIVDPKRHQFRCLTNLRSLALTGNPLKHIESHLLAEMDNLHDVDLRFTNVMQADANAFSHGSLQELTIQYSNWFVDQHHEACCISPSIFNGTNLYLADVSFNNFRYADNDTITTLLHPLRTVRKLMIANVGITRIPQVVSDLFSELEVLGFQGNFMSDIPHGAFDKMTKLQYLDLSDNDLSDPEVEVLRRLVEEQKVRINLESNPFSCTCDLLHFLDVYKVHRDRRPPGHNISMNGTGGFVGHHYTCYAPSSLHNVSLEHLHITIHTCLLTVVQEILIYFVCFFFILCLLSYALLYKYRWQVRYWLYRLHERLVKPPLPPEPHPRARFTAFVSYCKEDSNFVLSQALPALERNHRLALCIHERDFIPGTYISQNVVERMGESCHVLLVLSNNFLKNDWCRFELFVAQQYGLIHRRIPVTVLQLEPLRVELMDAHVIALLQSVPAMEWPGWAAGSQRSRRAVETFWSRLGRSLGSNVRR